MQLLHMRAKDALLSDLFFTSCVKVRLRPESVYEAVITVTGTDTKVTLYCALQLVRPLQHLLCARKVQESACNFRLSRGFKIR